MKIKNQLYIRKILMEIVPLISVIMFVVFALIGLKIKNNLLFPQIALISGLISVISMFYILYSYDNKTTVKNENKLKIIKKINKTKKELFNIKNISKEKKKNILENLYSEVDFILKNINLSKDELNFNLIPSYIKIKNLANKEKYKEEVKNKLNSFKHIDNHKKNEIINNLDLELERFDKNNETIIKIEELPIYSYIFEIERNNLKKEIEIHNNKVKYILNKIPEEIVIKENINNLYLNENIIKNDRENKKTKEILEQKTNELNKIDNDLKIKNLFEVNI